MKEIGILMVVCLVDMVMVAPIVAAPLPQEPVGEIVFVIDCSSSMGWRAGDPSRPNASRWDLLQQAYPRWLNRLPASVRVGAISVGGNCTPGSIFRFPAGTDRGTISAAIRQASPDGSTPLNAALRETPALFDKTVPGEKRVVLLSDGENSCEPTASTCDLIKELRRDHGIGLDVIIFGGDQALWNEAQCWADAGAGIATLSKTLDQLRNIPLPAFDPWPYIVAALMMAALMLTTQAAYRHLHHVHAWSSDKAIVSAALFGFIGVTISYSVLFVAAGLVPSVLGAVLLLGLFWLSGREPRGWASGGQIE